MAEIRLQHGLSLYKLGACPLLLRHAFSCFSFSRPAAEARRLPQGVRHGR